MKVESIRWSTAGRTKERKLCFEFKKYWNEVHGEDIYDVNKGYKLTKREYIALLQGVEKSKKHFIILQ
jgi:hypothetical protein